MKDPLLNIVIFHIILLLNACQNHTESSKISTKMNTIEFQGISESSTDSQKYNIRATNQVKINGVKYDIDFHELIRTNQQIGKETFGLLKDVKGSALKNPNGSNKICRNNSGPDHTSLLKFQNQLFAITHFECPVGGAYVMGLDQDKNNGTLKVSSLKAVDFSSVYGTYIGCAGMTTPWGYTSG